MRRLLPLLLLASANWADAKEFELVNARLQERTDAVLAVMGYSVVPDLTTSTLSITNLDTGNPQIVMSQLAGGFTVSKSTPLYLEGGIAYSRYDPVFLATNGGESRSIPLRWTSVMLTSGVGWDFPVAEHLVARPIVNLAYGRLKTDVAALQSFHEYQTGTSLGFADGGSLDAFGYGGSLVLDYEDYKPEREIDVEWRYSYVRLENVKSTQGFIAGSNDAISSSLWARWRAPTGWTVMERPLRYVLEVAHSSFWGDQALVLGCDSLNSVGAGIEFDSSAHDIIVTRTRIVARYRFGATVAGVSIGLAVSF